MGLERWGVLPKGEGPKEADLLWKFEEGGMDWEWRGMGGRMGSPFWDGKGVGGGRKIEGGRSLEEKSKGSSSLMRKGSFSGCGRRVGWVALMDSSIRLLR